MRLFIGILSLSVFFSFSASTSFRGGVFVTKRYSEEELNCAFAAGLKEPFSSPLSLYSRMVASPRQGSILQNTHFPLSEIRCSDMRSHPTISSNVMALFSWACMDRPEANNKRLIKCMELLINLIDLF